MTHNRGVYVTKHQIRHQQNLVYQLHAKHGREPTDSNNFCSQYDSKRDSVTCKCRNISATPDMRYYSESPKQIAYHRSRSFTNIGVGSVKALQRRKVKRVYLPDIDNKGVGSSDLSSFVVRPQKCSFYDHKRTSSKCVGGIIEYNIGCVISEKLSPIIQTRSGATSPKVPIEQTNIEIGSNTVDKNLVTTATQFEDDSKPLEHIENIQTAKIKESSKIVINISQKFKYTSEVHDIKKTIIEKKINNVDKVYSSDSLVQHVHNLENPSDEKGSRVSIADPMENKLEREYRMLFSTRVKESKENMEKPMPELKSTSILRRRFEALRRGKKKEEEKKKMPSSQDSFPSRKDASVTSDPPSLQGRSYTDTKKYSPAHDYVEQDKVKVSYGTNRDSTPPQQGDLDNDCQGVKGMFKLWGKKFNFEEQSAEKVKTTPKISLSIDINKKPKEPKHEEPKPKKEKEGRKFFFFKRKNKDKKVKETTNTKVEVKPKEKVNDPYKPSGVTAGRCEIRDGLAQYWKVGRATPTEKVSEFPRMEPSSADILRKTWLRKFLSKTIESARSVNIRWNNSMYATSSSTVFELLDTIYQNHGVVLKSRSEITTEGSSEFQSYTQNKVNFDRNIQAYMIPKTIPNRNNQIPAIIQSNRQMKEKGIGITTSEKRWFIEKSKAFANKIEIVLDSINFNKTTSKVSSECLKIDIPKDFFNDSSSDASKQHNTSDEEVYKIVEYESDLNTGKVCSPSDFKVIVKMQDSTHMKSNMLETVIKRPPLQRDVVIQGSNVNIPKRCDVIGVGIITQRDLRDMRKPILKIQDDLTDDSEIALQANVKKCEFAESYLQEYYRHWTPLGMDLFSWCVSDTQMRSSSEKSQISVFHQGDGCKSCPNIFEDFQAALISSYQTSSCSKCSDEQCLSSKNKKSKKEKKVKSSKTDTDMMRVLPKDSLEVLKKRQTYATSMKSRWACSDLITVSTPSKASKGAQGTSVECPKLDKSQCHITKKKRKPCNKHVSLPDCESMNELLADQICDKDLVGILSFKDCKKDTRCPRHAVLRPNPTCEMPPRPCEKSCEKMKKPACYKPNSPTCSVSPKSPASPCETPICPLKTCGPREECVPGVCSKHKGSKLPQKSSVCRCPLPSCAVCARGKSPPPCASPPPKCPQPPRKCQSAPPPCQPPPCQPPPCPPTPPKCQPPPCFSPKPPSPPPCPASLPPCQQSCPPPSQPRPRARRNASANLCVRCVDSTNISQTSLASSKCPSPKFSHDSLTPVTSLCPQCQKPRPCPQFPNCKLTLADSPQRTPERSSQTSPECSPQGSPRQGCSPSPSANQGLSLKSTAQPKCPPKNPKPKPCKVPPCSEIGLPPCQPRTPKPQPSCSDNQVSKCKKKCPKLPSCPPPPNTEKECKPNCANQKKKKECPEQQQAVCPAVKPQSCPTSTQCPANIQQPCPELSQEKCPVMKPPCPPEVKKSFIETSKQKISGLFLKMKASQKKASCAKECQAWPDDGKDQNCDNITICMKPQTPSTEEIREGLNIKVQDIDGNTLFERRDYTCSQMGLTPSVLRHTYKNCEINRVSTPVLIAKDVVDTNDYKDTEVCKEVTDYQSEQSLANTIEIQFQLRITQGDKTTEISIGNEKEKLDKASDVGKTSPEVFIVGDEVKDTNDPTEDHGKHDINIKIIVKNYKHGNEKQGTNCEDEFSRKITNKFQTVSTGYSDIVAEPEIGMLSVQRTNDLVCADLGSKSNMYKQVTEQVVDNTFSVHRMVIDLESADVGSKSSKPSNEDDTEELTRSLNLMASSHSTEHIATDFTEDENIDKSVSSKKETSCNNNYDMENTTEIDNNDTEDTDQEINLELTVSNDDFTFSDVTFDAKKEKKELLKKIFEKSHNKPKNKENVRQLRNILKVILTDSSENDEVNAPSSELAKDVTYTSLKPDYFRNTDSMNNYYRIGSSPMSAENNATSNTLYPTEESNSAASTNISLIKAQGCMCNKVAERLNCGLKFGCCCRKQSKLDEVTSCDIRNEKTSFLFNCQTAKYADVETQNSKEVSSKSISINVSTRSRNKSKDHNEINNVIVTENVGITNVTDNVRDKDVKALPKNYIKDCERRRLNRNTILGISDDDKVVLLTNSATKTKTKENKRNNMNLLTTADVLQCYEMKKAVLEIYAEKTLSENSEHLIAKLPKFMYVKENEIRNYEHRSNSGYESIYNENVRIVVGE